MYIKLVDYPCIPYRASIIPQEIIASCLSKTELKLYLYFLDVETDGSWLLSLRSPPVTPIAPMGTKGKHIKCNSIVLMTLCRFRY